jgi:hypothetical protein
MTLQIFPHLFNGKITNFPSYFKSIVSFQHINSPYYG